MDVPGTAENDRNEARVLRCLLFRRQTLDVLCDSLGLQCHEVRDALDVLEAAGLVRPRGRVGAGMLAFDLTEAGQTRAFDGLTERERGLAEHGLAPDDLECLRRLAGGGAPARRPECEWGVGATRQRLWEAGLVDVLGFIRPRVVLTDRGRSLLSTIGAGPG
ncbi:hypothetical protein [Pseudonocardia sp. MH-G8]|uniref:hypothetical protein n=1 Tax=Pseudonocardia sp. MH-G8 TaxID=1854588 RepID=UPI0013045142|nr:hypothetical protein [Pseudonocardia sp. MH-G8]